MSLNINGKKISKILIEDKNNVIFEGTEADLIKLIIDCKSIAKAIRADLDLEEGINDNDVFDYEQYKDFSKKY